MYVYSGAPQVLAAGDYHYENFGKLLHVIASFYANAAVSRQFVFQGVKHEYKKN